MKLSGYKVFLENEHDQGTRELQEDYFSFSIPREPEGEGPLGLILADGMGGLTDGATTSVVVVDTFCEGIRSGEPLEQCARRSHEAIRALADATGEMGSTVVSVTLAPDGTGNWLSVGDSTIYLFRNGDLHQLNRHHVLGSLLDEAVAGFLITPEEAGERQPERDHLISYLGMPGAPLVEECLTLLWQPGDVFLLASDGLTDILSREEIRDILRKSRTGELCRDLLDAVKATGRPEFDNTTIVAASILPTARLEKEPPRGNHRMTLALVLLVLALILVFLIGLSLGLKIGQDRGRRACPDPPQIMKRQGP